LVQEPLLPAPDTWLRNSGAARDFRFAATLGRFSRRALALAANC